MSDEQATHLLVGGRIRSFPVSSLHRPVMASRAPLLCRPSGEARPDVSSVRGVEVAEPEVWAEMSGGYLVESAFDRWCSYGRIGADQIEAPEPTCDQLGRMDRNCEGVAACV